MVDSENALNFPRQGSLDQIRLMAKIARLYHELGMKQVDVAKELHISQTRVSRLLRRANEQGLVRTTLVLPPGINTDLEAELEETYGLDAAVIVDDPGTEQGLVRALAGSAAEYFEATLIDVDVVGFSSWSLSLLTSVAAMSPITSNGVKEVVQVVGGVGQPDIQAQANQTMYRFAELLGASPRFLSAPGLLETQAAVESLLSDQALHPIVNAWENLSVVIVGIGATSPSPFYRASGNAVTEADEKELHRLGAVGDVCLRYFDADGRALDTSLNKRVVGISPETYRNVPRRIAVAGGARKHAAIRAAVLGGWVSTLITDTSTARYLMKAAPKES